MSKDWCADIAEMHDKYKVRGWVVNNPEKLKAFLNFRVAFLAEELQETATAVSERDSEEIVDGLIDLCVVAIGTLDAFAVNPYEAWDRVLKANMAKEVGQKATRPNSLGLPDLIKPTMESHGYDWVAPSHEGNHGLFKTI
jgi:hypothetical protein